MPNKDKEEKKEIGKTSKFGKAYSGRDLLSPESLNKKTQIKKSSFALPLEASEQSRLKTSLTESLSPSIFGHENPNLQEDEKLEQFISSQESVAKSIFLSPFYVSGIVGSSNRKSWKKILKQHIVQTYESLCIIKKLKPIANSLIEEKMLPKEPKRIKGITINK
jgi:hypothetical protein